MALTAKQFWPCFMPKHKARARRAKCSSATTGAVKVFLPLLGARCRLWVATGDATPDLNTLACFEVSGQQGFTLHKGVWHHPLIALEASSFLVIERQGPQDDCEVFTLLQAVHPTWPAD